MIWIIRRRQLDKPRAMYLAPPGSDQTYTRNARKAQRFPTREAALAECGSDERPEEL